MISRTCSQNYHKLEPEHVNCSVSRCLCAKSSARRARESNLGPGMAYPTRQTHTVRGNVKANHIQLVFQSNCLQLCLKGGEIGEFSDAGGPVGLLQGEHKLQGCNQVCLFKYIDGVDLRARLCWYVGEGFQCGLRRAVV